MRGWSDRRRALHEQIDQACAAAAAADALIEDMPTGSTSRVNLSLYHVEIDEHLLLSGVQLPRRGGSTHSGEDRERSFHHGKLVATHLHSLRPYQPTSLPTTCWARLPPVPATEHAERGPCERRQQLATTPRRPHGVRPAFAPASRAGVPLLHGHPSACVRLTLSAWRLDARGRALALGARSYSSVAAILEDGFRTASPANRRQGSLSHREHPRSRLPPVEGGIDADHPLAERLVSASASPPWPILLRNAERSFRPPPISRARTGFTCCSTAK